MDKKWRCIITVILIFFLFDSVASAQQKKWKVLELSTGKKISISVSGKSSEYVILEKNKQLELMIIGPNRLKIISRLNFPNGTGTYENYTLEIKENNKIIKSYSTSSDPSSATYKNYSGVPGKSRKFILDVPDGVHSYSIQLAHSPSEVLLRFLIQSAGVKSRLASITPIEYEKAVIAILKEKPLSYYTCTSTKPVKVKIIGPTMLRIVTRLNYGSNMKGKQKYQLLVEENGKIIHKKALETTKSLTVTYKDFKTVVPGKSKTFHMDVPGGQHTYIFKLGESIANSVSMRFSIPEKDLNN